MRILHVYCLNYNIGDYALGMGVKNLLRDNFEVDLIGNTNIQGREFNKYYIDEVVNKKYDLLVIGGGGIIHGSHWPNGWFWLIEKELIKTIKTPFIVYGVGNNYFEGESIPERAVEHLRETYKYAKHFSVRNDESYERVTDQLGFKPDEVPDPGFHVSLNTDYDRSIIQPYVIIQLANDKTGQRFSEKHKKDFIVGLRKITKDISKDYRVVFAPHVLEDVSISMEVAEGIENTEILNFGNFAFDHSHKMVAYYKYAEFVLAMRGHGQIIPIGFNVPVIALQNHPKHIGLMRKLGLQEYNIDINSSNFFESLQAAIEHLKKNRTLLLEKYHKINSSHAEKSKAAMIEIKKSIDT